MIMTDNKDLKYTQQFKKEPNIPKTYEQFILVEEKDLTQQNLYPDLGYEGISEPRGYGPSGYDKYSNNWNKKSDDHPNQHLIGTLNSLGGPKYDL